MDLLRECCTLPFKINVQELVKHKNIHDRLTATCIIVHKNGGFDKSVSVFPMVRTSHSHNCCRNPVLGLMVGLHLIM